MVSAIVLITCEKGMINTAGQTLAESTASAKCIP